MIDTVTDSLRHKLQKIELNMLLIVDDICKQLDIHYFMVGGTLLGAVRHKGFIPWDDDIDIGMIRCDYEKFVKYAPSMLPQNLFLQTMFTDYNAPFNFTKIRNSETTFIETSTKNFDMNHGIFIDVFPFDYYPESKMVSKIRKIAISLMSLKVISTLYFEQEPNFSKLGKAGCYISGLVFQDVRSALIARERIYRLTSKSRFVTNYNGAWGDREVVPLEWVSSYIKLPFEGYYLSAPKDYDKYLRNIYGDYMQLPPPEKRVGHHYAEVIDVEKPYTFYCNNA